MTMLKSTKKMKESDLVPYAPAEIAAERLLAFAAHPDDEVFGAGGLLARVAMKAESVRVVVFTGGEAQEKIVDGSSDPDVRRREAREAGAVLGVFDYRFLDFPDRSLAQRGHEVAERVEAEIAAFSPDVILAPSPSEIHPDHRGLADAVYRTVARSRPQDPDHALYRLLKIVFYEVSQPLLPNALVPLAGFAARKREAMEKFVSQAAVRDYAGAVEGLNAYRGLTLAGAGPAEAFRVESGNRIFTTSLEEFRRLVGLGAISAGSREPAPAAAIVRTKNRPALVREAVESLARQTARPQRVVVVNDGGVSPAEALSPWRDAFELVVRDLPESRGRSAAANLGAAEAGRELFGFLDDDDVYAPDHFERLLAARAAGPEPIVYSDAVTVVFEREGEGWRERHRELQYSMDFDAEYLLYANYIPLHTVLFDASLFQLAGGFDPELEYSEDWDLLIRLSRLAPFRHVRAVTAQYRVFPDEAGHAPAGAEAFQAARATILQRYRDSRSDAVAARVLDRISRRLWEAQERERVSAGELAYRRASHHELDRQLAQASRNAEESGRREQERATRIAELDGERSRLQEQHTHLETVSGRQIEEMSGQMHALFSEIERLNALIKEMEGTKAWRLHVLAQKVRRRS
jgi:LmbE family N-acetylglucosaminyl deacetylase